MEKYILSSNELAVLNALWDAERPLTRSEMLQSIHKTDWNPNSIHMVLNNLIRKGVIRLMSAMAKNKGVSQHTIQKLEQMLEEMRKTLREESAGPEKEG